MKYDRKIKSLVRSIKYESDCYLDDVEYLNECASTDRRLEVIISKAHELEKYHEKRFNISQKNVDKQNKSMER